MNSLPPSTAPKSPICGAGCTSGVGFRYTGPWIVGTVPAMGELLTVSRRFPFAASLRLGGEGAPGEALHLWGKTARARHSVGANYVATVGFAGPVEPLTGMLVNLAVVKERIQVLLAARWDHHFLNRDHPAFSTLPPTLENLAQALLAEAREAFAGETAQPVVCHLAESPSAGAAAYADGRVERWAAAEFCAARRTLSPHLDESANRALFGAATRLHGHSYRLRVTLAGKVDARSGVIVPEGELQGALRALREELDHRYLNEDVPALRSGPVTSEWLARHAFLRLQAALPVARTRLWELSWLSAEYLGGERARLVVESSFRAAHRLHAPRLDEVTNRTIYGKCNNPTGHGHRYVVEAACGGVLDPASGTVADLGEVQRALEGSLARWQMVHLDEETSDFCDRPSTSENIVSILWPRLDDALRGRLQRLRLWETENNRFTLRRVVGGK